MPYMPHIFPIDQGVEGVEGAAGAVDPDSVAGVDFCIGKKGGKRGKNRKQLMQDMWIVHDARFVLPIWSRLEKHQFGLKKQQPLSHLEKWRMSPSSGIFFREPPRSRQLPRKTERKNIDSLILAPLNQVGKLGIPEI